MTSPITTSDVNANLIDALRRIQSLSEACVTAGEALSSKTLLAVLSDVAGFATMRAEAAEKHTRTVPTR